MNKKVKKAKSIFWYLERIVCLLISILIGVLGIAFLYAVIVFCLLFL